MHLSSSHKRIYWIWVKVRLQENILPKYASKILKKNSGTMWRCSFQRDVGSKGKKVQLPHRNWLFPGNTFDKWRDKKLNGMVMPFVEWERKTCNLWTERRFRWLWTAMFLTAKWRWKPHDLNSKCPKMEFSQWLKRS